MDDKPKNQFMIGGLIAFCTVALLHVLNNLDGNSDFIYAGSIFGVVLPSLCGYFMIARAYHDKLGGFWVVEKVALIGIFGTFFGTFALIVAHNGRIGLLFLATSVIVAIIFAYLKEIESRLDD